MNTATLNCSAILISLERVFPSTCCLSAKNEKKLLLKNKVKIQN